MTAFAQSPSYQIRFERRPEYLYAYVEGDWVTYNIAKRYWAEIIEMLLRHGYNRLLVDKSIFQPLPVTDAFTVMSELAHHVTSRAVKLAIADHYYDPENCRFEKMVGTNRGLKINIVQDVEEAEKWLLDD